MFPASTVWPAYCGKSFARNPFLRDRPKSTRSIHVHPILVIAFRLLRFPAGAMTPPSIPAARSTDDAATLALIHLVTINHSSIHAHNLAELHETESTQTSEAFRPDNASP